MPSEEPQSDKPDDLQESWRFVDEHGKPLRFTTESGEEVSGISRYDQIVAVMEAFLRDETTTIKELIQHEVIFIITSNERYLTQARRRLLQSGMSREELMDKASEQTQEGDEPPIAVELIKGSEDTSHALVVSFLNYLEAYFSSELSSLIDYAKDTETREVSLESVHTAIRRNLIDRFDTRLRLALRDIDREEQPQLYIETVETVVNATHPRSVAVGELKRVSVSIDSLRTAD